MRDQHGAANPSWKGGRIHDGYGYVLLKQLDHPKSDAHGYVREHIVVWEREHHKPLPNGWVVHHLNGIKDDNSPANLVGLPDKQHKGILAAKAKRIQELEALLKQQGQLV